MNIVYRFLNGIGFLSKRYSLKFLSVVFICTQVPILILLLYFLIRLHDLSGWFIAAIALLGIPGSLFLTLNLLNKLLEPLILSKTALEEYLRQKKMPALPGNYQDEAGLLMEKIQLTLETLDNTLSEKKDLIALLSHDVRSPLSQVIGMCTLIKLTTDKDEINEYCDILIHEMNNQLIFLEQIVRMNRLDNMDAAFIERQAILVSEIVDRAMHSLNTQTIDKQLTWEFQIEKDLKIFVNPHLFSQAIQNLISNAIKFSYENSTILISGREEKGMKIIEVKDEGLGFNPEESKKIFNRFTSHSKQGTHGEKSSGIGLYLSKNIIERHDGSIEAFSEGPNKGSTFTIALKNKASFPGVS